MISDICLKYKNEVKLVEKVIQWHKEPALFKTAINRLELESLRAYTILLIHYTQTKKLDKFFFFTLRDLFEIINQNTQLMQNDSELFDYLIDIFEIYIRNIVESETAILETLNEYYLAALNGDGLELYLKIGYRVNSTISTGLSCHIQRALISLLHSSNLQSTALIKVLLLLENCFTTHPEHSETGLHLIWETSKECIAKTECCEKCHAVFTQLFPTFLNQSETDGLVNKILCDNNFSKFIYTGLLSSEQVVKKQTVYLVKHVIDFILKRHAMPVQLGPFEWNGTNEDFSKLWQNYFLIVESLQEIQKHLIIATLEQFLVDIDANFPPYWSNILYLSMLRHENAHVSEYAINFILKHKICFANRDTLNSDFYSALNSTSLFQNSEFEHKHFKRFLQENLHQMLQCALDINWKIVPLTSILNTVSHCLTNKTVADIDTSTLLNFLKMCLQIAKSYYLFEKTIKNTVVEIVEAAGYKGFGILDLLQLYDSVKDKKLIGHHTQPLTIPVFEDILMKNNTISRSTKIEYFKEAIPNLNDRLQFLDNFFAREHETFLINYVDYEIILFDNLQEEKSLTNALQIFKSRLYNMIKPNQSITVHSTLAAVTVLEFITSRYIVDGFENFTAFATIKEIFDNFYNIFKTKSFLIQDSEIESNIAIRLKLINANLILCKNLYPDKINVAVILREALLFDGFKLNLHRFNNANKDDVTMMQSTFDWYMTESVDVKANIRAKNVSIILSEFPNIKCDLEQVFSVLLSGLAPISCILRLENQSATQTFDNILIEALLYGAELQGEKKLEYEFGTALNSACLTYHQTVRLTAMKFIEKECNKERIKHLKNMLFEKNTEIYRPRYFFNSHQHVIKLRLMQALAVLFRLDNEWDDRILDGILKESNQTNVTFITEMIIAETIDPDAIFDVIDKIDGNKGLTSMLAIIYYVCCKHKHNRQLITKCVEFVMKWIFVKQIAVRSSAYIIFVKLYEKLDFNKEQYTNIYKNLSEFLISLDSFASSKGVWKWSYAYDFRFNVIDCDNLLHPNYILCEIPRVTQMVGDGNYCAAFDWKHGQLSIEVNLTADRCEFLRENEISLAVSNDSSGYGSQDGNVQRKVIPFRERFVDKQLLKGLPEEFQLHMKKKTDSELIVVTSLVSKVPNLGGIARSSEVFGVKSVVMDNMNVTSRSEFQALSKAAEKWLHIVEIKSHYMCNYLLAMKSKGYCIVGAEQTSCGKPLQAVAIPRKMILVVGHEKDGIPANILNLLDLAIEVPQFGVVRSLNVHVTAALFMWEYCKQHLISA